MDADFPSEQPLLRGSIDFIQTPLEYDIPRILQSEHDQMHLIETKEVARISTDLPPLLGMCWLALFTSSLWKQSDLISWRQENTQYH